MTTLEIPVATVTDKDGRQSIVLPPGLHLDTELVFVKKMGDSLLLVPKRSGVRDRADFEIDPVSDDFLAERVQPPFETREALFE